MRADSETLRIFSGNANPELAYKIARHLDLPLGKLHVARFADGEVQVKIDESARGMDVFIVQPTCAPVNETLMELLILVDAFRRASARRITLVMPYFGYARQDKKIKPREPVTARLVADLITAAGAHRVLSIDLHAKQIQGFFQLPLDHLYAGPLLGAHFAEQGLTDHDTVVVSPDVGGVGRARGMAEMLHAPLAIIAKRRPEPNQVEIMEIIGDVQGQDVRDGGRHDRHRRLHRLRGLRPDGAGRAPRLRLLHPPRPVRHRRGPHRELAHRRTDHHRHHPRQRATSAPAPPRSR